MTAEYLYGTKEFPSTTAEKLTYGLALLDKLVSDSKSCPKQISDVANYVNQNNKILQGGL